MKRPRIADPNAPTPAVIRLANELAGAPPLLQLRTRRLVADLRSARGAGKSTAARAVALARRWVTT